MCWVDFFWFITGVVGSDLQGSCFDMYLAVLYPGWWISGGMTEGKYRIV